MAEPVEFSSLLDAIREITVAIKDKSAAEKEAEKQAKDLADAEARLEKAERKREQAIEKTISAFGKLGNQVIDMARVGTEYAKTIGTTATRGVQLELKNRSAVLSQLGRIEADRMVSMQQMQSAQSALTDTFISTRNGMQLSAEGTARFAQNLKGGFKSEFELTGASLQALTVIGATTEGQMDAFRRATGRASLSSTQLSTIVNKNSMSFLLYGKSFAKAATDAERMGISLSSIQSAQEGMVSNLDNVIDTVAQLNQLGAGIDFGTLVQRLEQEGPDAVLQYLSSATPGNLFQSTSFRALFNQLGINSEQILRQQQVGSAADSIESQMTEAGKAAGGTAKALTETSRAFDILGTTFGKLGLSAFGASIALFNLATASKALQAAQVMRGGMPGAGGAPVGGVPPVGGAAAGLGMTAMGGAKIGGGFGAVTGIMSGIGEYQKSGSVSRAFGKGLANLVGSIVGGALGSFIPIPGVGTMVGAAAGGWAANWLFDKVFSADDMLSGYGNRTLLTPSGAFALNNKDTVVAGTKLFKGNDVTSFGEGALRVEKEATKPKQEVPVSSNLDKKIDALISAIANANTVINVNGNTQMAKRMTMATVSVDTTRGA